MIKNKVFYIFFLFFLIQNYNSYSAESDNSMEVVGKIERNLIYSKEILKNDEADDILIQKGGWTQEDTKSIEKNTHKEKKIKANIKKKTEDKNVISLKRKAYNAINIGQYEIAIKLYKEVLKINKNDSYAILGLATAYQYLGQYVQAKPLYLKILESFPNDQQIMANLLSIITEETPYEAVYLLSGIADKNRNSPLFQAQTSMAYSKIKDYKKAIEYIERAIELNPNNIEYKYNLAVLCDMNEEYEKALFFYNDLINNYNSDYNLPIEDIQDRINLLKSE